MKFLVAVLAVATFALTGCGSSTSINNGNQDPNRKADTPMSFDAWQAFTGVYQLVAFDGVDVSADQHSSEVRAESNRYVGPNGTWMRLINFKLLSQYSQNTSQSWNFGPLDQVGYSYTYPTDIGTMSMYEVSNAQVSQGGQIYNVSLHLEVQKLGRPGDANSMLNVSYTLSIPAIGENSSHRFVLRR